MNSNICLTQATVNILDISRLAKLINICSCHGYTRIDTSADMNCGYTRTIEGIYMSQVIERIRYSSELLVDRLNYYVRSKSADLLVIPLKYNLFSEFEGDSLVNWMNMYNLDNSLVIQENY